MLEHYLHIRIDAKCQALDALDAARRKTSPKGTGNGHGGSSRGNEGGPTAGGIDALVEVSDEPHVTVTSQSAVERVSAAR